MFIKKLFKDFYYTKLIIMATTKSQRKRSRPVQKQSPFKKKSFVYGLLLIVLIVIIASAVVLLSNNNNENNNEQTGNPIAVIDTSMGIIKVELYQDLVPITVNNFVKLANEGFYDGLVFHRVIDGFVIQGGGFEPDGTQHNSDQITFETNPNALHDDGAIAMASTGAGVGGTNQFYICDGAQHGLDGNYAVFGITIEGLDVVKEIASVDTTTKYGMSDWPTNDVIINSITIENQ